MFSEIYEKKIGQMERVSIMPFHFCSDELFALMSLIPIIGIFFKKIHIWWHKKFNHKCHEKGCEQEHVDHVKNKDEE